MDREAKTAKAKVGGKLPPVRRPRPRAAADDRSVEQRLADALAQQAATSDILRVMSASPTDVQPVIDAVAEQAARLCHATFAHVLLVEGNQMRAMDHYSADGGSPIAMNAVPLQRTSITGRAVLDRATVHHADVVPLLDSEYPAARENAIQGGFRAVLAVPLMHKGNAYGGIFLWRREVGLFAPDQVALVETFATQAAIAIENVRLFRATQEALEQQTATSEILRVISGSQTDVQPVFETIAANALRLCDAQFSAIFRYDGELIHIGAFQNVDPAGVTAFRTAYPCRPSRGGTTQRAILTGQIVHMPDIRLDPEYMYQDVAKAADYRGVLSVPMLREGRPIGAITVYRDVARPFPDTQIELLKTFADQAVIAIENVRLFSELEVRNRDLTIALDQQTATSEILRVISSAQTDVKPVFDAIVSSAVRLCGADHSIAARFDGEFLHAIAFHGFSPEALQMTERMFPMRPGPENMLGRTALNKAVVNLPDMLADPTYSQDFAMAGGWRSGLGVPMLRDGEMIGGIAVSRREPGAFPDHLVALLTTFADQAVIAVENVRLFTELEARNRDLTEALEQQTATSDILRVISQSQTDAQPVFETIAEAARKLCRASSGHVVTFDGELIHLAALSNLNPGVADALRQIFPRRPSRDIGSTRALLTGSVVEIPDVLEDREYALPGAALSAGYRSVLAVPLIREGAPIGAIGIARPESGPFPDAQIALLKTFADQAVIAIENVRLFKELEARNHDLTEALEQQTATSDILRVISRSQTDVQPVFDTIVAATMKLCRASSANVFTFDGELIHLAALVNVHPEYYAAIRQVFPRPPSRDTAVGRAILARNVVVIPDVLEDPEYAILAQSLAGGFRSVVAVPLIRDGNPIGAIIVGGPEPGPFPDTQVELLKTFADQAVIAIENVRLFKELEVRNHDLTEALEQQTATSDILRVISQSQTDVQPVFDTIAKAAHDLCDAQSANVFTYDGDLVRLAAVVNADAAYVEAVHRLYPRTLSRDTAVLRAIMTRSIVTIPDAVEDPDYIGPMGVRSAAGGFRSILAVPLMREGSAIGGIAVGRAEAGPFPETQVALLQTFADQAVIAIENVRLFTELEIRNRDLTEALEQQTATSDILRVISQSQTDVQPVFDTIAKAAHDLCGAQSANVFTYDGELVHLAALVNMEPAYVEAARRLYPRPLSRDTAVLRAIMTRSIVAIPDVMEDSEYVPVLAARSVAGGFRSALAVPLMREGIAIGGIAVGRAAAGPFPETQVALLQTFADQAVIAIENVRLFKELEAQTNALTRSVSELQALGDVGQAVSSTLDLETVLSTIVARATQLTGTDGGAVYEYDEDREEFYLHTADRLPDELVEALRAMPIRKGEGVLGRMAITAEPVQIRDILDEGSYQSRIREVLLRLGFRSILAVPLMRDNHLLGGLTVNRKTPGEFDSQVIDLLKTFATQSALAIQNARLFREIEIKSRQLETASQHKSEFLANMSHELRTPLNAIIGFSEVLSERLFGEMNEKQTEYVGDISESGRHLLNLINDILDLSKIEAGRMELDPSDFDIATTINNTLSLVRERAQRREIALRSTVDPRLGKIHADERKVRQVLLNLLSNALKFTPEGGAVDVRATACDDRTEIAVTDTGVGIAPGDQEAVFEEFRQVGATAKKIEGTGLGLAISRKFVELHGGRIWVTSQLGVGSTFTFTLPLR